MRFLYSLSIRLYGFFLYLASFFHTKASQWIQGRKHWKTQLNPKACQGIWMHCSSSGEFEQGRPILEALAQQYPHLPILLTFFSPSGYELRKNYTGATHVCYLPLDTPENAHHFIHFYQPKLTIFVKYDLWVHFLEESLSQNIPTILVAAYMRANSFFLKTSLYRSLLQKLDKIYVQRPEIIDLLTSIGVPSEKLQMAGDPRLDRCWAIATQGEPILLIEQWLSGKKLCCVAGSIWPADEKIMEKLIAQINRNDIAWILVPHEISPSHIQSIQQKFPEAIRYTELEKSEKKSNILIFDTMGMLSRLYRYSDLVYIGGGFGSSIHNTLEPAAWGNRIYFGPAHHKFPEAEELIHAKAALCVHNASELIEDVKTQLSDIAHLKQDKLKSSVWMQENKGATHIIIQDIIHQFDSQLKC